MVCYVILEQLKFMPISYLRPFFLFSLSLSLWAKVNNNKNPKSFSSKFSPKNPQIRFPGRKGFSIDLFNPQKATATSNKTQVSLSPRLLNLASDVLKSLFPPRQRKSPPLLLVPEIRATRRTIPTMDFNPFKYCSGLRYLGYLMLLMVLGIIGLTYWAVVVIDWGPKLIHGGHQSFLAAFILVVFHILVS